MIEQSLDDIYSLASPVTNLHATEGKRGAILERRICKLMRILHDIDVDDDQMRFGRGKTILKRAFPRAIASSRAGRVDARSSENARPAEKQQSMQILSNYMMRKRLRK